MVALGCALDAQNPAACPPPSAYPFLIATLVARDTPEFYAYATLMGAAGKGLYYIMAGETFAGRPYAEVARAIAANAPASLAYVLGNEPDEPPPAPSSWTMTPSDYGVLWAEAGAAIRAVRPGATLALAGMSSGDPVTAARYYRAAWMAGPIPGAGVVHLYPDPDAPDDPTALLNGYHAAYQGLRLLVLEYNVAAPQIAAYTAGILSVAEAACFYAWASDQGESRALHDDQGQPTAEYDALLTAAHGGTPMADTEIDKLIRAHPERVGTVYKRATLAAASGPYPTGTEYAYCDGGMLLAVPGVPGAYLLPDQTSVLFPQAGA